MTQQYKIRRDSSAWVFQVWASFAIAVGLCVYGIWNLPGPPEGKMLLAMGFFFCLSSSFVLAKAIRDNQYKAVDTPMWRGQVWAAFIIASCLTGWTLSRIKLDESYVMFLAASWLFLVSSTFTLTKTVRDGQDADKMEKMSQGGAEEDEFDDPKVELGKR
jgi:hypothetical protein